MPEASKLPVPQFVPSQAETRDILLWLISLTPWQLKELATKESIPVWVVSYAVALLKDIKAGKTTTLERIARRVAAIPPTNNEGSTSSALPLQLELFQDL